MNTKKLVALLLSVLMLVSILPVYAMATDSTDSNYELRVLTFEDADYKGSTNFAGGSNWTTLIDSPQYGGTMLYPNGTGTTVDSEAYTWYDAGNTELKHTLPKSWDTYCYWGGGHAISNYVSSDFETHGSFEYQLTVYNKNASTGVDTTGGGHNGSNNFAVHFGYKDNSGYTDSQILPSLSFGDGSEHVIDHMYVNNICYALNCYLNGNGLTAKISDTDWVKLTATGYDAAGTKTGDAEIYLCNGPTNIITEWTKFDLSGLGKVNKVEFNITGSSDNGYGFSQPAYFAYDDVAVRFEKTAETISTAEELIAFAEKVSAGETTLDATVVADIDMSAYTEFAGVGTEANPYAGNFDGGGHTITMKTTVQNSTYGTNYRAGVIAFAAGATIHDVVMAGSITAYNGCGIVGCTTSGETTIENCSSSATLNGSNPCGGILGEAKAKTTIRNCTYSGTIGTDSTVMGDNKGGIVGKLTAEGCLIENCSNSGNILNPATTGSGSVRLGGIVGYVNAASCTISKCSNSGKVKGHSNIGGIVGSADKAASGLTVENCFNTGSITATYLSSTQRGVGGIIGTSAYCSSFTIRNVYNTGSITNSGTGSKYAGAGGIAGYIYETTTIENAYNIGKVSATGETRHGSILGYSLKAGNKFVNTYWLENSDTAMYSGISQTVDGMVDASNSDALKALASTLGEAFADDSQNVNNGYPVLAWQLPEPEVLLGDVNEDGEVTKLDAVMVYGAYNGTLELTEAQITLADVNGDGEITNMDAALIYAYYNGTLDSFPAAK